MKYVTNKFKEQVFKEIEEQRGNARFPCPVGLAYEGKPTEAAIRLGVDQHDDGVILYAIEDMVFKAVKDLQADGRIKFVYRWGYTWVVPQYMNIPEAEIIDCPTDRPWNWERL